MRLKRHLTAFASLVFGLALVGMTGCAAVKADPITQMHAGYVMYPDSGKAYIQAGAHLLPPQFICLRGQNSTVRWFIAMDGLPGASSSSASARAGLVLGCANGSPTYVPFYGIYGAGKNTADKHFAPVHIHPGDNVNVAVGQGNGNVEFQLLVSPASGQPKRVTFRADIFVPSGQITGSAAGCLLDATTGAPTLPRSTPFIVQGCGAYTDYAGHGLFFAPNHGNQATRSYNVTTKSGKPLTRLDNFTYQLEGYFNIIER